MQLNALYQQNHLHKNLHLIIELKILINYEP